MIPRGRFGTTGLLSRAVASVPNGWRLNGPVGAAIHRLAHRPVAIQPIVRAVCAGICVAIVSACGVYDDATRLQSAVEDVAAIQHPYIRVIRYIKDFPLSQGSVQVRLARSLDGAAARTVWCEVLLPRGLDRTNTVVEATGGRSAWPQPKAC